MSHSTIRPADVDLDFSAQLISLGLIPGPAPLTPAEEYTLKHSCYRCGVSCYPDGSFTPRCNLCLSWEADPRHAGRLDEPGRPTAADPDDLTDIGDYPQDEADEVARAEWAAIERARWEAEERPEWIAEDDLYDDLFELGRIRDMEYEAGYRYL